MSHSNQGKPENFGYNGKASTVHVSKNPKHNGPKEKFLHSHHPEDALPPREEGEIYCNYIEKVRG